MAAAKLISAPLISFPCKFKGSSCQQEQWIGPGPRIQKPKRLVGHLSLQDPTFVETSTPAIFHLAENAGYSLASYYTSLGLFVISVPGLWSLIKRSVKSKVLFVLCLSCVSDRNRHVHRLAENSGRTVIIRFEGMMVPSRGQAALLTFCTCISLASVALVLTITIPEGGNRWYWLTILSPLAGAYYWKRASRKEQIKVKMMVADDGSLSEIVVQGDDGQVEEMRKDLKLSEKGMIYVKGIFERS